MGCSNTAATFPSRYAGLRAASLVVCYPERCDELSWNLLAAIEVSYRALPDYQQHPSSGPKRLAESRIIEDHIMVGQARNILNADKVCSAPLRKLTWTSRDWPARGRGDGRSGVSHLLGARLQVQGASCEGLKGDLQRGTPTLWACCPTVARKRPCRFDISFEGPYRVSA